MSNSVRSHFLLDPEIIFLNHGSFGACPRPVFDVYQAWQRRLERQPVQFLGREYNQLMQVVRQKLSAFMNCTADDLALVPNATFAVNLVARSLRLNEDDEILTTDHEYGACDRIWQFICQANHAHYRQQPVPVPYHNAGEFLQSLWAGINTHTRLIFLSHITSPTAMIFPVAEVCQRARAEGIPVFIDGAHAPGQTPVDLQAIGADFYAANCHKWMMAPKGSAFLFAGKHVQDILEPLVVSWGWQPGTGFSTGSQFIDHLQWYGTRDPAAHLAIPAALDFIHENKWEEVQQYCHGLLSSALERFEILFDNQSIYQGNHYLYRQMACIPLPNTVKAPELKKQLYDDFKIEVPVLEWKEYKFLRLSVQGYNTVEDIQALELACQTIFS
jgi:isopenicillin-N epimerase